MNAQLLNETIKLSDGKHDVLLTIDKLGYVQIDPLSVIERAHHHTLWTRIPDYYPDMLYELQSKDRKVFEYWGHALSYFPMSDYRYCLPRMRNFDNPENRWANDRLEQFGSFIQHVLERIKKEGPLSPEDFAQKDEKKTKSEDILKSAKAAIDLLFWKGELMITERRKLQKIYDLSERVLPDHVDTTFPKEDELGQFFVRRALSAYGVALEKEIWIFMQPESSRDSHMLAAKKDIISKALCDLVETGDVISITVKSDPQSTYYALPEQIDYSEKFKNISQSVFLLSPFDNLIIRRERVKRLFGFDYALECYMPAAKRRYGYFVLPILWGQKFIGRLDPKADRKKRTLIIQNLVFEDNFKAFEDFLLPFAVKLVNFASFNLCEKITFEKISPIKIKNSIESLVKDSGMEI